MTGGGQKGHGMLRLIFTICMIDAPGSCEQREMLVYEAMTVTSCVTGAMPELAVWKETHPNWRIARWRCEHDGAARGSERADEPARHALPAPDAMQPGAKAAALSR